jgi:hypothetical protein
MIIKEIPEKYCIIIIIIIIRLSLGPTVTVRDRLFHDQSATTVRHGAGKFE